MYHCQRVKRKFTIFESYLLSCLFVSVTLAAVVAGGMDAEEENSERTNSEVRCIIFTNVC